MNIVEEFYQLYPHTKLYRKAKGQIHFTQGIIWEFLEKHQMHEHFYKEPFTSTFLNLDNG